MGRGSLVRLDQLLVQRGLVGSRQRARELIESGGVTVDGMVASKAATQVRTDQAVELAREDFPWVGRGALKLLGVLGPLGVDPAGRVCADLGASTGGFTEVLLHHGATKVFAIDVGKGQLDWKLRTDPRVVNMEGVNARHLQELPEPVSLIVGDLSFISLSLVLPAVHRLLQPGGEAVLMVKPQFEAGREAIASGGVVRSASARLAAIDRVRDDAVAAGFALVGECESPVAGAKSGNVEHFLHLVRLPYSSSPPPSSSPSS